MLSINGEYSNEYVIWLEDILFKFLLKDQNEKDDLIDLMRKQLNIIGSNFCNDDYFLQYLLEKDERDRYEKQWLLFNVKYIDDCDMNQFYLSLLSKDENIIIDEKEKIKKLKLLLCEFLSQCGYDTLKFQRKILENKVNDKKEQANDKKRFDKVEVSDNNGKKITITVFYGTLRGLTTWYAKKDKSSSKIIKDKNGNYVYRVNDKKMYILDKDVIDFISKDYD